MIWLGLFLALVSAVLINLGMFVEHRATSGTATLSVRHPLTSLFQLAKNPMWLLGYASGWIGWGGYVAALWFAPLSLVQGVAAGGIGVLALLIELFGGVRLRRGEWVAVGASMVGLVLIGTTVGLSPHIHSEGHRAGTVLVALGVLVLIGGLVFAGAARLSNWGGALAAVAGVCYAAGDVATKAALLHEGWIFVGLLIVGNVLAFVALQLSFQRGGALGTVGVSILLNNALPIGAGIIVFGEHLPRGPAGYLRVIAFLAAIASASYLAMRPPPSHGGGSNDGSEGREDAGGVTGGAAPPLPIARVGATGMPWARAWPEKGQHCSVDDTHSISLANHFDQVE